MLFLRDFWKNTDALGGIGGLISQYGCLFFFEIIGDLITGVGTGVIGGFITTIISWMSDALVGVGTGVTAGWIATIISWISDAIVGCGTGVISGGIGAAYTTATSMIEEIGDIVSAIFG